MIGKRGYVVSYRGLNKDSWIECQDYLQSQRTVSVSTFIDVDKLRRSSDEFIALIEEGEGTIDPGKLVNIGTFDF